MTRLVTQLFKPVDIALLLDPNVDLVAVERKLGHATCIQPLEMPFRWR
jgi:hypothetical protein